MKDGRSSVIREACIVVAKISMEQSRHMTRYVPQFLNPLFELMRMTIAVMAVSSTQASRTMVSCIPDSKNQILNCVIKHATKDQHKLGRLRAFELIVLLLEIDAPRSRAWWNKVHNALKEGMFDSSQDVRTIAYETVAFCEIQQPGSCNNLIENLGLAGRRRFDNVLDDQREVRENVRKRDPSFD